ncbi:MAG: MBL fold metallo-hydrolase [Anaerolineales bacterium]|nr:MBL fold metallo-hydrolase [Anaerolineales bacterium]MBS3752582.1 MBL fold metallo-hydrolase [Anaerolineales bacterium]
MIHRERVADNVYTFQSDLYAQVNAGAVIGQEWAVVIDTLAFPDETLAIRDFIENELERKVRYVIDTHYHADHSWGNCFFPGALVIGHELCRTFLQEYGVPSLKEAWKEDTIFRKTQIVLPHLTMKDGELELIVDDKSLRFISLPGHSRDGIGIYIVEDEVLFSGDVWMPVPHIVDGDTDVMRESLRKIGKLTLENVVQGHGDVILRGEIESGIEDRIDYLDQIEEIVQEASENEFPGDILKENDIESCGKSRIMLDGLAEEIHQQNLRHLYLERFDEEPKEFDESVYY